MLCIVLSFQESNASGDDFGDIDWNTEDELEISEIPISTSNLPTPGGVTIVCNGEVYALNFSIDSRVNKHFFCCFRVQSDK